MEARAREEVKRALLAGLTVKVRVVCRGPDGKVKWEDDAIVAPVNGHEPQSGKEQ